MKSAIYIEGGFIQLVLTPENEFEKAAVGMFREQQYTLGKGTVLDAEMFQGTFYNCSGGWTRQSEPCSHDQGRKSDHSIIIRMRPAPA